MAAPNLLTPVTINGKTATPVSLTTSAQSLLSNASGSGKCLKVNRIWFANIDGANSADVTFNLYSQAAIAGTATALLFTVAVPPDSTLVFDGPLYLEEDKSIGALASASSDIMATVSYEDIS